MDDENRTRLRRFTADPHHQMSTPTMRSGMRESNSPTNAPKAPGPPRALSPSSALRGFSTPLGPVPPVGIEPTSPALQASAVTRSAEGAWYSLRDSNPRPRIESPGILPLDEGSKRRRRSSSLERARNDPEPAARIELAQPAYEAGSPPWRLAGGCPLRCFMTTADARARCERVAVVGSPRAPCRRRRLHGRESNPR